jgi:hypothetical protein
MALPQPAETTLTAVLVLATAVWVGGLVAIFVVARVACATLGMAERVAFFRGPSAPSSQRDIPSSVAPGRGKQGPGH